MRHQNSAEGHFRHQVHQTEEMCWDSEEADNTRYSGDHKVPFPGGNKHQTGEESIRLIPHAAICYSWLCTSRAARYVSIPPLYIEGVTH